MTKQTADVEVNTRGPSNSERRPLLKSVVVGSMLGLVLYVAVGFVLSQLWSLDPVTVRCEVETEAIEVDWEKADWQPGKTGLTSNTPVLFTSPSTEQAGGEAATDRTAIDRIEFDQEVLSIAVKDHLGNEPFRVRLVARGWVTNDASEYSFQADSVGGGTTDGAAAIDVSFDEPRRQLLVDIKQYFNRAQEAVSADLSFTFENGQFQLTP